MKVILSRKGFDSGSGAMPSPILPDNTLLSLPIPSRNEIKYSDLYFNNINYYDLIKNLNHKFSYQYCHLDPDIYKGLNPLAGPTWKAAFGQTGQSQSHLLNQGISDKALNDGVLFLFYGWFRHTESKNGILKFINKEAGFHAIYGYLFVDRILKNNDIIEQFPWHPHASEQYGNINCLYVAKDWINIGEKRFPGYGTFIFNDSLKLSLQGDKRSKWDYKKLPKGLKNNEVSLSYHNNACKDSYFKNVGRGQEFVFSENDAVSNWAIDLITNNKCI